MNIRSTRTFFVAILAVSDACAPRQLVLQGVWRKR